jgi:RHS repeat-associated protein
VNNAKRRNLGAWNYDAVGQLLSEGGLWPNDTVKFTYANRLRTGLNVQSPDNPAWAQSYDYDSARRLTDTTSPAGSFGYAYEPVQLQCVERLTLPNGAVITNAYDDVARQTLTALVNSSGTDLDSYQYGYNKASQRTNVVRAAGDYVYYIYDTVGELTFATGYDPGGLIRIFDRFEYGYDAAGNLLSRARPFAPAKTGYGLNSLNQITNSTMGGPGFGGWLNLLSVSGSTTTPATNVTINGQTANLYVDNSFADNLYVTNGVNTFTAIATNVFGTTSTNTSVANVITNNSAYAYDLNGNLLTDGTRNFAYDDENELISVWQTNVWRNDFVYDGKLRRRIEKDFTWSGSVWSQTNETHFIYDGNLVVQERNTNNQPVVEYTRGKDLFGSFQGSGGIGGLLARSQDSLPPTPFYAAHAYYHADGNGNITAMINASQTIVAKYLYDSFGNLLAQNGSLADANQYRFSSKEWNKNSELYYYLYRFYDPSFQRWPNRDPLGEPGFETLHLVSQPLFIRKLRLNINDSEMQYFLAMAMQSGSIDVGSYLRNSHSSYRGNTISPLAFFNLLRNGQGNYAPNWPVELLEYPNLYEYVGNTPVNGVDPQGLWWGYIPTSGEEFWDWFKAVFSHVSDVTDIGNIGNDTLKCGQGMYNIITNEPPKIHYDPYDPNSPVPPTAG